VATFGLEDLKMFFLLLLFTTTLSFISKKFSEMLNWLKKQKVQRLKVDKRMCLSKIYGFFFFFKHLSTILISIS
jgi:hypothetical protein